MKNIFSANRGKPLRIIAALLACGIVFGLLYFAVALLGNPVSQALATRTARMHLAAQYGDTDYEIDTVSYDFKTGGYYAHVKSPTLLDGHFTLYLDMLGRLTGDDYDYRLERHGNTATRLYAEYRALVQSLLESPAFPYAYSIGFGDLDFDIEVGEEPMTDAISREELENHKIYDIRALGTTNGRLVLYVDTDTHTAEAAAEILQTLKRLLDGAGVGCYTVELVLQYPPYEQGSYKRPEGSYRVRSLPYAEIDSAELVTLVEQCHQKTLAEDAEK